MPGIVYQPSFLQPTITKSVTFSVPGASDLRLKTIDYFSKSNFRQTSALMDQKIISQRGSLLSNMYTFNPLKWKSEIQIDIQGQEVSVQVKINTFAQLPSLKEETLWDDFLQNYEAYLNDGRLDYFSKNKAFLKSVKRAAIAAQAGYCWVRWWPAFLRCCWPFGQVLTPLLPWVRAWVRCTI